MAAHRPSANTRRQVAALVAFGNSEAQIAAVIGCTPAELLELYASELHPPGRPPHQPTEESRGTVESMAVHETEANIAKVLGIDAKTLRRHYADELDNAHVKARAMVVQNLYALALGKGREAVTAATAWLNRFGYREQAESPQQSTQPTRKRPVYVGKTAERAAAAKQASAVGKFATPPPPRALN